MRRGLRILAALGPGDIVGAHRSHLGGGWTRGETSLLFSGQLIEFCKLRGIGLLGIGTNPRRDRIVDGDIRLEQAPKPLASLSGGPGYHLRQIGYALMLTWRAIRYRPDVALIDSGTTHYFMLTLLRWLGVRIIVNFHNVLWPIGFRGMGRATRVQHALDGYFFRRHVGATLGCSPACGDEVEELAGRRVPYFEWRAQFDTRGFPEAPPEVPARPFHIIFVGRAEQNKGVLDIVDMAKLLKQRMPGAVQFDVCGDGAALSALREKVVAEKLGDIVQVHGRLNRTELLQVYAQSAAVIVPTRSTFCEGLPLVCAEAMLSGRPLITSRVSNALPVLGPAISEAEVDDVASFVAAIERLALDPDEYRQRRAACPALARQFIDRERSYPARIDDALAAILPDWTPLETHEAIFEVLLPPEL